MNDRKLNRLFEAARAQTPPDVPENFEGRVMREINSARRPAEISLFDQLHLLFPKLALAAVVVILASVVSEFALRLPDLADGAAQISEQWLFTGN